MGYFTKTQVGVANFRIDIGVKNREDGNYICGVECDGATYHSSHNARENDRIREDVLIKKGWNIYRIWSTDWFKNREEQIDKLRKHLVMLSFNDLG